jgi:hypothetical protein
VINEANAQRRKRRPPAQLSASRESSSNREVELDSAVRAWVASLPERQRLLNVGLPGHLTAVSSPSCVTNRSWSSTRQRGHVTDATRPRDSQLAMSRSHVRLARSCLARSSLPLSHE